MDREALKTLATKEAQEARLAALKGKSMLFVAGDFMYPGIHVSLSDHLKMLRSHGLTIHAVFQIGKENGDYYTKAKELGCFDTAFFADVGAENGHDDIVKALKEVGITSVDGVWSPHETTQPIVSNVQKLLGCPGNSPEAYENARDKYLTRKRLDEANLNTIRACQIWSMKDAAKAASEVGFPMIVKPTVGMGSIGVYKARDEIELEELLERLFDDINNTWNLSRNKIGRQAPILAETFITPTIFGNKISEFDIEIIVFDKKLVYGNVIDNWEPQPPYFQDLASCAPSITPKSVQEELIQYCYESVLALGFERGGFHMEAWYTPTGPVLIEANPRIGGGATATTHEKVWGVDPMLEFTLAMLDIPINPPRFEEPQCSYGLVLVNAPRTGNLSMEIDFLKPIDKHTMVTKTAYLVKPGQAIKGLDTGVPDWLAEIHFENSSDGVNDMILTMEKLLDTTTQCAAQQTIAMLLPQQ